MTLSRPSLPVRLIKKLPFGRFQVLRIWNRVQRLRGDVIVDTYFGAKMLVNSREIIQASIAHFGIWEPEASEIFSRLISKGDTVIDIGANIGYFSLLYSHAVGPDGHVVAIEAMPAFADRIKYHARINRVSNIRTVNVAVTDKACQVSLYNPPSGNNGATTIRSDKGYAKGNTIDGLPLIDILTLKERENAVFIKCDIEGAEGPVMSDILNNIDKYPMLKFIAVEANIQEVPDWSFLFYRFINNGFKPYQVPNNIVDAWMKILDGENHPPIKEINKLSQQCSDILFIKQ